MNLLSSFAFWLPPVASIIFVHECGHYWFARLAGVSKKNVRIQMFRFPQHVVLRNADGKWISPWQQPLYGQLCGQYFRGNRPQLIRYVGSGLIVGSLFVMIGTWSLFLAGLSRWAFNFVFLSAQIHALYLFLDFYLYIWSRRPFGDFTGLFLLSKPAFCIVSFGVVILHATAFLVFHLGH